MFTCCNQPRFGGSAANRHAALAPPVGNEPVSGPHVGLTEISGTVAEQPQPDNAASQRRRVIFKNADRQVSVDQCVSQHLFGHFVEHRTVVPELIGRAAQRLGDPSPEHVLEQGQDFVPHAHPGENGREIVRILMWLQPEICAYLPRHLPPDAE